MSHVLPAAYAADVDRCLTSCLRNRQVSYKLLMQHTGVLPAAYATYRCLTSCLRNIQVSYQLLTQQTGVLPAAYATDRCLTSCLRNRQVSYQLLTQQGHLIAQLAQQRLLVDYLIHMRLHCHPLGRICKVQRHPGVVSCTCTTKKHRFSHY